MILHGIVESFLETKSSPKKTRILLFCCFKLLIITCDSRPISFQQKTELNFGLCTRVNIQITRIQFQNDMKNNQATKLDLLAFNYIPRNCRS